MSGGRSVARPGQDCRFPIGYCREASDPFEPSHFSNRHWAVTEHVQVCLGFGHPRPATYPSASACLRLMQARQSPMGGRFSSKTGSAAQLGGEALTLKSAPHKDAAPLAALSVASF